MNPWTLEQMPDLTGKIVIVTGGNSGLGLETSARLAERGATLVMACRDRGRAQAALDQVRRLAPRGQAEVMELDLADLASIRRFAGDFSARHPRLDILCNNAGVMALPLKRTKDGFEMLMGTNHLGPYALTGLLLDSLRAAPAARVVTVASIAHRLAKASDLDDLNWERGPYNKARAYARSKLANLLFALELSRRLRQAGSQVLSVAAHPGYAATNIGVGGGAQDAPAVRKLALWLGNLLFAQPAERGALPTLCAATSSEIASGDYVGPGGLFEFRGLPVKVACTATARDAGLAARLWQRSEELTGVSYELNASAG